MLARLSIVPVVGETESGSAQQCNQARDSRSKATNVAGPVVKYARPIKLNMPNVFQSTLGVLQCLKN